MIALDDPVSPNIREEPVAKIEPSTSRLYVVAVQPTPNLAADDAPNE